MTTTPTSFEGLLVGIVHTITSITRTGRITKRQRNDIKAFHNCFEKEFREICFGSRPRHVDILCGAFEIQDVNEIKGVITHFISDLHRMSTYIDKEILAIDIELIKRMLNRVDKMHKHNLKKTDALVY